jgi:hypothetical protein
VSTLESPPEEELDSRSDELEAALIAASAVTSAELAAQLGAQTLITVAATALIPTLWAAHIEHALSLLTNMYLDAAGAVLNAVDPDGARGLHLLNKSIVDKFTTDTRVRLIALTDSAQEAMRGSITAGLREDESPAHLIARAVDAGAVISGNRALLVAVTEMHAAAQAGMYAQALALSDHMVITRTWQATHDDRVREWHLKADGQSARIDEPFLVGDSWLLAPSVPMPGRHFDVGDICNCRCGVRYNFDVITTSMSVDGGGQYMSASTSLKPGETTLTAAGDKWQPHKHPRGKDGRFIEKGALSTLFSKSKLNIVDVAEGVHSLDKKQWDNLTDAQKQHVKDSVDKLPSSSQIHKQSKQKLDLLESSHVVPSASVKPVVKKPAPSSVKVNKPIDASGNVKSVYGTHQHVLEPYTKRPANYDDNKSIQEDEHAFFAAMASVPFDKEKYDKNDPEWQGTRTYQSMIAERWNKALRAGKPFVGNTDEETKRVAVAQKGLDDLMAKSSMITDIRVWRGVSDQNGRIAASLKKGTVFQDNGYSSTAVKRSVAESFAEYNGLLFDIEVPAGSRGIVSTQFTTRYLDEWEVVLPRGSRFEVLEEPKNIPGTHQKVVKVRAVTDVPSYAKKSIGAAPSAPKNITPSTKELNIPKTKTAPSVPAVKATPAAKATPSVKPIAAHKGAAPGSPAKVSTTLVWGKYDDGDVILESNDGMHRVIWDGNAKKYAMQSRSAVHEDWSTDSLHTKKSFYDGNKNTTGWVVPTGGKTDKLNAPEPKLESKLKSEPKPKPVSKPESKVTSSEDTSLKYNDSDVIDDWPSILLDEDHGSGNVIALSASNKARVVYDSKDADGNPTYFMQTRQSTNDPWTNLVTGDDPWVDIGNGMTASQISQFVQAVGGTWLATSPSGALKKSIAKKPSAKMPGDELTGDDASELWASLDNKSSGDVIALGSYLDNIFRITVTPDGKMKMQSLGDSGIVSIATLNNENELNSVLNAPGYKWVTPKPSSVTPSPEPSAPAITTGPVHVSPAVHELDANSPLGVGGDILGITNTQKKDMKAVFKDAKTGYWSKPEKIWESIQAVQQKYPEMSALQVIKSLDSTLKTADPSPFEAKMTKWASTSKGQSIISKSLTPSTPSASNAVGAPNLPTLPKPPTVPFHSGSDDISHISAKQQQDIFKKFKTNNLYVYSPPKDIYNSAKHEAESNNLSIAQVLKIIDEQDAVRNGVSNQNLYENSITDWLGTKLGAATAAGNIKSSEIVNKIPNYSPGVSAASILNFNASSAYTYDTMSVAEAHLFATNVLNQGTLSSQQKIALSRYTGNSYGPINRYLNGFEDTLSPSYANTAKHAQAAMRASDKPILLHRNISYRSITNATTHEDLEKVVGQTWMSGGFFSTSVGGSAAFGLKPVKLEIEAPPGTPMAWLEPHTQHPGEREMLLAAGLHYRIVSVKKTDKGSTVRLRVVPSTEEVTV